MKTILHDWNDEQWVQVLRNINRRAPPGGHVPFVEQVIPEIETTHFATLFDIDLRC
jgi:hypothetical protein